MWDAAKRQSIEDRLSQLTPSHSARWGKMSARQMLAHVTDAGRMALGELPAKPKKLPVRYFPFKQLFVYALPFPKNAPTAPELLGRSAEDWQTELRELRATMGRLVAKSTRAFPEHPAFGKMSAQAWGVLIYKHMDHHLRQFGI